MTEGVKATNSANARLDAILSAQKEKDIAEREQDKERDERYIESISAQADATNSLVDVLKKQGLDNSSLKDEIHTMTTQGSKPLNDLITKFDSLQTDVQAIKTTNDSDHQAIDLILHDIAEMKAIVIRIDQRRTTKEVNRVEVVNTNPLPVEVTNP